MNIFCTKKKEENKNLKNKKVGNVNIGVVIT